MSEHDEAERQSQRQMDLEDELEIGQDPVQRGAGGSARSSGP